MPLAPRILVADDDQALSRTLSWILKENGYDVLTIPGGEHLFEHLDDRPLHARDVRGSLRRLFGRRGQGASVDLARA